MSVITAAAVGQLRQKTGAGMMDCKKALVEAEGDAGKAEILIRQKGLQKVAKKAGRTASEGFVGCYQHHDGKKAVLVELNCETDFVARNEKFQELANNLAMHVLALRPTYVSREQVPEDARKREEEVILGSEELQSKPEAAREKIVEGKMRKFFEQSCLLDQAFVKDETGKTIDQVLKDAIVNLGENIQIRRFTKIEVGSD